MARRFGFTRIATSVAVLTLAAACGQQTSERSASVNTTECVKVDEGNYLFQDGKFVRANAPVPTVIEKVVVEQAEAPWYQGIEDNFSTRGYSWMGLNVRRNTATLIGLAPDAETKAAAFELGKEAILAAPEGAGFNVIDGISVEGGERAVGAALAELDDTPSLSSCQAAFTNTMQGRNVEFQIGSSEILEASARLLDAVSGVATLCNAYQIEIGGHTDDIGGSDNNQRLSERRAMAVKAYLASKGVDTTSISAVGYGETRPIDVTGTRVGKARNRRTEFTVSAQ